MQKLETDTLFQLNKSYSELAQLLSPALSDSNKQLFYLNSGNQDKFNRELLIKGIKYSPIINESLESALKRIQKRTMSVIEICESTNDRKSKYDLDIARIFHEELNISKRVVRMYDFWRCITLFYFIELTKWRWEKDPNKDSNWYSNASTIFNRSLGLTFDHKRFLEDNYVSVSSRNMRINAFRYWWIADKLYEMDKGYDLLEKLSEKCKSDDAVMQDFINLLEGNRLVSPNDRVSKVIAKYIFLKGKKYKEEEIRKCFIRYNAYNNRLFMIADEETIGKEICLVGQQ